MQAQKVNKHQALSVENPKNFPDCFCWEFVTALRLKIISSDGVDHSGRTLQNMNNMYDASHLQIDYNQILVV